ncbi:MAG: hypothetical protein WBM83_06585, partial [Flavobacteriaceae bacterium]
LLSAFALLLVSNLLLGQQGVVNLESFDGQGQLGNLFAEMRKKKNITSDLPTVGSIYIDDTFLPCKVYYEDDLVGNFFYRHNAFNDEIEIKDTKYAEEPESSLLTIKELRLLDPVGNKELALRVYENKKGELRNGYLYRLGEGKNYDIFFKNNVKYTEGTRPVNSLTRPTPNKFSHFTEYYFIKKGDKKAHYVEQKNSKFVKAFDKSIRENLSSFLKNEKINLKKEEDLIKTFEYLNTL